MDKLEILDCTTNPMDVIARVAGTSYGKDDYSHKRVKTCFDRGHLSVFEQAWITLKIWGISRACANQLVRHRFISVCQESQRYVKVDTEHEWYVIPTTFQNDGFDDMYHRTMNECTHSYDWSVNTYDIKAEDARYLLPNACKTTLSISMNVRELFHFLDLRTDKAAQWEIRDLANQIMCLVEDINEQWAELISMWHERAEGVELIRPEGKSEIFPRCICPKCKETVQAPHSRYCQNCGVKIKQVQ